MFLFIQHKYQKQAESCRREENRAPDRRYENLHALLIISGCKYSNISRRMKQHRGQKAAVQLITECNGDPENTTVDPLHQIAMIDAEQQAAQYHCRRYPEITLQPMIDYSPKYGLFRKRRHYAIRQYADPEMHIILSCRYVLISGGSFRHPKKRQKNIGSQRQRYRKQN